jgi:HlyD family secretion protein
LFSIGQDLTHMMVYTNTDEADVGRIQVGAQATFRVDTFPRETFHGRVAQVRMNATTIQNVVTYNTTIAFDNLDLRLFPGMTAYVSIPVAWANNVVKIPNGALRFKPDLTDSERNALYAKYGITDNARGTPAGRMAAVVSPAAGGGDPPAAASPAIGTGAVNAAGGGATGRQGGAGRGGQGGQGGQGGGGNRPAQGGASGAGTDTGQNGGRGAGANSQRQDAGLVWKLLPDKSLEPVQVGVGVTDFTFTAMLSGKLTPGDELVIGQASNKTTTQTQNRSLMPGGARRF